MTATKTGMAIGAVLAIVGIAFGFWPLVLTAVAIAIGALIGRVVDGKLDLRALGDTLGGRRRSS